MQKNFPLSSLALLCLALASFHGELLPVHGQDFSFPSGKLTKDSLTSLKGGDVDSSGTLILDASSGDAQAFYSEPISLYDTASNSLLSFATFFTFASNVTSGNGTVAFVVVPDAAEEGGLVTARKTFTVELNASCGMVGPRLFNESWDGTWPGGRGRGGHGGRGFFNRGGLGGFQVVEYANNTQVAVLAQGGYGPDWDGTYDYGNGSYFCAQQPPADLTNPIFQYQVVLQYNATTDTVWVGSPSCGGAIARTTQFSAHNLSSIINKPMYVGFIVSGGGVFNFSQWNFTSNATSNTVTSLALSASTTTGAGGGGSVGSGGGGGRSRGLGKGWVVAFAILGAAIGVGLVVAAVCCVCAARRRRRRVTSAPTKFVAKSVHAGEIPARAVVFDATKNAAKKVERDTTPLNTFPNSASTQAPSWLQPVAPR